MRIKFSMKKKVIYFLCFWALCLNLAISQESTELKVATDYERHLAEIVPPVSNESNEKILMPPCGANAANDNFANAINLVVNAGLTNGQTCGTLEPGEFIACAGTAQSSVWYKFTATATTHYVQATYVSGACWFTSVVYDKNIVSVPTATCSGAKYPLSCQSASGGPNTALHRLTNLTIGSVYYIQLLYNITGCVNLSNFTIQVTTANPGGYLTNPGPQNSCSTPSVGCYFAAPPTVAAVTGGCPAYNLASTGYSNNAVWNATFQYTNSATVSNVSLQAIISSNCGAGNVYWFNWKLYDCSCNFIACGTISGLTVVGLACGTCYRFEYEMEFQNCTNFGNIWPYQNIPAVPIPCTVLPIELLYFTGNVNRETSSIDLEWKVAVEKGIREYKLEKSLDGVNFVTFGKPINSKGSDSKYNVIDKEISNDKMYYYKLTAINNDGSEETSKVIVLAAKGDIGGIKLVPNPALDAFELLMNESQEALSIDIFNAIGQKVKEVKTETTSFKTKIDISDLQAGLYFVNVSASGGTVFIQKLIKE